jgi:hypothetical protein
VWREVDGEVVVLEVESGNYLNLNGSAGVLWRALVDPASTEELIDVLRTTFGISEEQAEMDVRVFLDDLNQRSLVEPEV